VPAGHDCPPRLAVGRLVGIRPLRVDKEFTDLSFDVDVGPHISSLMPMVQTDGTRIRGAQKSLSTQRRLAGLTAVKFPEFFCTSDSRPGLQLDQN